MKLAGIHFNKLEGPHLAHLGPLNSAWHLLLDPEPGQVAAVKARSPGTKVLARPFVPDHEVHQWYLDGDPAAAGRRAADICLAQRPANPTADAWIVLNEPPVEHAGQIERLAQFDIAFMERLRAAGARGGIGAFSVGTLQLPEIDGGAAIRAYAPALRRAKELGALLCIHQYMPSGPQTALPADGKYFHFRWQQGILPYCDRHDIPTPQYLISETGCDIGADRRGYTGQYVGWKIARPHGFGDDAQGRADYLRALQRLAEEYSQDPDCVGMTIFCAGGNGDMRWESFRVDDLLAALGAAAFPAPGQNAPAPEPVPPPGGSMITDQLAAALQAEFGSNFVDLRAVLPRHASLRYRTIDSRGFDYIAVHHSETPKNRTWENIAAYHIRADNTRTPPKEPWAGIGYHIGVRMGTVALFDSLDTERAHVYGMNHEALGVCVTGTYDTTTLDERDHDALKRLIRVLDRVYGHEKIIKGHGELRVGGYTACPGSDIKRVLPTLRQAAPPPPPPLPEYTELDREKAEWFVAQMARALRGDEAAAAALFGAIVAEPKRVGLHNVIVEKALPPLKKGAA